MINYYKKLTEDIPYTYGDGLRNFIYDVNKRLFFLVQRNKQHIDVITQILNKTEEQIEENPMIASHLVPVNIFFEDNKVKRVMIGLSGSGMGFKIKHSKEDIKRTYDASLEFIKNGEHKKSDNFEIEINKRCII